MNDVLAQTESGREIARRNRVRGREQGRFDVMRALLSASDRDDLAWRLAGCDHDGNIARIVAGATVAELWFLSCAQVARATPIVLRELS